MALDSDIAVLEWLDDSGEWVALAYIGTNRSGGRVDEYSDDSQMYDGRNLRIRYLHDGQMQQKVQ